MKIYPPPTFGQLDKEIKWRKEDGELEPHYSDPDYTRASNMGVGLRVFIDFFVYMEVI